MWHARLQHFKHRQHFACLCLIVIGLFFVIRILLSIVSTPLQTCPTTINQSIETNLILSSGINVPLLKIYRFIRSARSSCSSCSITIFIDDVHNTDYRELAVLYNVTFLSYHEHSPQALKHLSIVSLRFVIYYHYLFHHPQFDRIYIGDLFDTLFQKNIFEQMRKYPHGQLYSFLESEQLTIGGCQIHRQWILPCFGEVVMKSLWNHSRSCAGSILGTYQGMMRYLSLMNSHITLKPQCNDQGIHNYLMYFILNDTTTIRVTHETGFLGTLGTTEWVYRNKYGLVLNKNEEVYSVIHQFHHSKQVKEQLDQEYRILPNNILRLKN